MGTDSSGPANVLRLATTTSTRDSGLLDELLPLFEAEQAVRVDVIAAGTGKAIQLGVAGDADVILVHARKAEDAFMAGGHGLRRVDVMYNRFEMIGPTDDPAHVKGLDPTDALHAIASSKARFVSRGDDSGTHKRELQLWEGERKTWDDYVETGQGMGRTLIIADQMRAYVLVDRGTYLAFKNKIELVPLVSDSPKLMNPYGAITVAQPGEYRKRIELANRFLDFLIAPTTQARIGEFRVAGESLFTPSHGQ